MASDFERLQNGPFQSASVVPIWDKDILKTSIRDERIAY
jgi:hypothetical protein